VKLFPSHKPAFSVLANPHKTGISENLLEQLRNPTSNFPGVTAGRGQRMARAIEVSRDDLGQIIEIRVSRKPFRQCLQDSSALRDTVGLHIGVVGESRTERSRVKTKVDAKVYVAEAKAVGAGEYRCASSMSIGSSANMRDTIDSLAPYAPLAALLGVLAAGGLVTMRFVNASESMADMYSQRILNEIDRDSSGSRKKGSSAEDPKPEEPEQEKPLP